MDWMAKAPRHLLANNFGISERAFPDFGEGMPVIVAAA